MHVCSPFVVTVTECHDCHIRAPLRPAPRQHNNHAFTLCFLIRHIQFSPQNKNASLLLLATRRLHAVPLVFDSRSHPLKIQLNPFAISGDPEWRLVPLTPVGKIQTIFIPTALVGFTNPNLSKSAYHGLLIFVPLIINLNVRPFGHSCQPIIRKKLS